MPIAWALRKDPDSSLRDSVAEYFAELEATNELAGIIDRYYFHVEDEFDYVGSQAFVHHFESRLPKYKAFFLRAAEETGVDWRLLAAMAYQESHWSPEAVSPTGVRGMMMLTRATAKMMGVENRTDALESIVGGASYFVRVTKKIPPRIAAPDRTRLALAAYNVGFGHLEDARIITEIQGGDPDFVGAGSGAPAVAHRSRLVRARAPGLRSRMGTRSLRGKRPALLRDSAVDDVRQRGRGKRLHGGGIIGARFFAPRC